MAKRSTGRMPEERVTLVCPAELSPDSRSQLERLGFRLTDRKREEEWRDAAGLVAEGEAGLPEWTGWVEKVMSQRTTRRDMPLLALLWGERVPHGLAGSIAAAFPASQVEPVRLLALSAGERALIGGEGEWVHRLRRFFARCGVISLVCRAAEVDAAAAALPRYLLWKQRFYQELGESCDRANARLDVVAKALGLDRRIGHGWLFPDGDGREADSFAARWLMREWEIVREKTNIRRVAVWALPRTLEWLPHRLTDAEEIRLYVPQSGQITNDLRSTWKRCLSPEESLSGADVLLIADADEAVRRLPLDGMKRRMRRPIVIDACSCYPLEEAEALGIAYRTYGQNTNIWEWIR